MTNRCIGVLCLMLLGLACAARHTEEIDTDLPPELPALFAPKIFQTPYQERGTPVFSPDMQEVYWSVVFEQGAPEVILTMRKTDSGWSAPEVAAFSGCYSDGNPCISPDGQRLYFDSRRPLDGDGEPKDKDIWFVQRRESGWSEPVRLGPQVNSDQIEAFPSVSAAGTLYFTSEKADYPYGIGIFQSRMVDGEHGAREFLPEPFNSTAGFDWCLCVDAQEKLAVWSSGRDGQEFDDLYCSFRQADGSWGAALRLSELYNSELNDRFPRLSHNGETLFFARPGGNFVTHFDSRQSYSALLRHYAAVDDDFYWVSTGGLEALIPRPID